MRMCGTPAASRSNGRGAVRRARTRCFLQPAQGGEEDPFKRRRRYSKVGGLVEHLLDEARDVHLAKADEDEQIVYGIVLEPDTVDAQADIYSAEEVRQAAHKYMEDHQNAGLMHQKIINDKAKVLESFHAPVTWRRNAKAVRSTRAA